MVVWISTISTRPNTRAERGVFLNGASNSSRRKRVHRRERGPQKNLPYYEIVGKGGDARPSSVFSVRRCFL
jgi:hypothetical protein